MYFVPDFCNSVPGFLDGNYMETATWKERNKPEKLDWRVVRGLLFANCDSYEEMKSEIYKDIRSLGRNFIRRKPGDFDNRLPRDFETFDTESVISILNLVEKAYEGGTRRTGEPDFAHVLRMIKGGTDLIRLNLKSYNSGRDIEPFNPRQAQYFFYMIALHDFFEDKRKIAGKELPLGKLDVSLATQKDKAVKIKLDIKRYGNPQFEEDPEKIIESENISIEGEMIDMSIFLAGLDSLRSDGGDTETQFNHLNEFADKYIKEFGYPNSRNLIIWFNLSFLTKFLDREDNMSNYLLGNKQINFDWDNRLLKVDNTTDLRRFKPPLIKDVIEKSRETIKNLLRSEQVMGTTMSLFNPNLSIIDLFNITVTRPMDALAAVKAGLNNYLLESKWNNKIYPHTTQKNDAFFFPEIQKLRPSRLAAYYLMGLGVNDIYGHNDWSKSGCWLPQAL